MGKSKEDPWNSGCSPPTSLTGRGNGETKGERERNEHAHEEVRAVQFRAVEFCAKVKILLLEITVRMFAKAGHTLGVLLYLGTGTLERIVRKRGSKRNSPFLHRLEGGN